MVGLQVQTMESCLEDELVYDFVSGQLTPDARSQVDGHLDGCDDCRTLVADIARSAEDEHSEPGSTGKSANSVALARGSMVGRYVLVDVLGQGAMGIVFTGYDPALHRKAAIKLLHVGASDESGHAQERLLREAQAMARLSHPNVVTIYEVGQVDEAVYLAMELVLGDTLGVWLEAPERSLLQVQDAFGQAALGLQAAHEAGLVHRDFKPDNVLVSESGRVQVTDFGLARGDDSMAEATRENSVVTETVDIDKLSETITQAGTILGTPLYMAPEQLRGGIATALSDQYAFCVTYYEALYGRRPFSGSNIPELLSSALDDEVTASGAQYSIPNKLHAILVRGLAPQEQDRFASMAELSLALATLNRPKRRGLIGAGVALGIVGILGGYTVIAGRNTHLGVAPCQGADALFEQSWTAELRAQMKTALAGPQKDESHLAMSVLSEFGRWREEWVFQHRTTCEATRVSGEQSESLLDLKMNCLARGLASFSVLSSEVATLQKGSVVDAADLVNALPDISMCLDSESLGSRTPPKAEEREEVANIEGGIDQVSALLAIGKYAQADKRAAELHQRALSLGYEPLIGNTALISARVKRELGALKDAQGLIDRAILSAIRSGSDRDLSIAWIEAVSIGGEVGAYSEALKQGKLARASLERIPGSLRLQSTLNNNIGVIFYHQQEWDKARASLEKNLALRTILFGPDDTRTARSHTNLGNLERATGHYAAALSHHERAFEIDRIALGDTHPVLGRHLHNQAGVRRMMKQPQLAVETYIRALSIKTKAYGEVHPEVALTQNSLGLLYSEEGDAASAEHFHRAALQAYGGEEHPDRGLSLYGLGRLQVKAGQMELAIANLGKAHEIFKRSFSSGDTRVVAALSALESAQNSLERKGKKLRSREKRKTSDKGEDSTEIPEGIYGAGRSWN